MIFKFRRSRPPKATIATLYGAIVAQARVPSFYLHFGVPDTLEGRFDMIVLHLFLVVRRIGRAGGQNSAVGQALFDRFCRDLDDNLREMGIGDLAVPRKMRGFAEAYFGRADSYGRALQRGDRAGVAAALARNVFSHGGPADLGPQRLADYMLEAVRVLDAAPDPATSGSVNFPDPDAIPAAMVAHASTADIDGETLRSHP